MNTDEYTTCHCEHCGEEKPLDKVYYTSCKWMCLDCMSQSPGYISCGRCGSTVDIAYLGDTTDPDSYDTFYVCRICVKNMMSAKDALQDSTLSDFYGPCADDLGTGEPEPICPDVEKEWAEVRKWAASADGRNPE